MKKWIKYSLIAVCIALFLFLMLPFVFSPSADEKIAKQQAAQQQAKPQIFTSNPLTTLMGRIAKFFGGRKDSPSRSAFNRANRKQQGPAEEFFIASQPTEKGSRDYIASASADGNEREDDRPNSDHSTPKNVYVVPVDNNVEWVLIRQEAPKDSPAGMHEVNIKEDPYTRYVKQERLARTAPALSSEKPQEVPDSRLARLFRPLGRFFGLKPKTTEGTQIASANGNTSTARRTGNTSNTLDRNRGKQVSSLPKAQDVNAAFRTTTKARRRSSRDRDSNEIELKDLVNPVYTIEQAAQLVATSAVARPGQQQGNVYQQQVQQYEQLVADRLRAHLLALSGGAEPTDQLGKTISCHIPEGLITYRPACDDALQEDDMNQLRAQNRQRFEERTNTSLAPSKLTPVLGVADNNTLPQIEIEEDIDTGADLNIKQMYRFMLENNDCSAKNCYWVANSEQQPKGLAETINAAGVDFEGDPLRKSGQIKNQFIEHELAALPPDATDEQKEQRRAEIQQYNPPYVLYTSSDMERLRGQLQETQNTPNATSLYIASPEDAQHLYETWGYNMPSFYARHAHQALTTDEQPLPARSATLVDDLADHVLFMQGVMQEIQRDASQQAVGNTVGPIVQEIQDQLAHEKETFDQNNPLGKTKK